MGQTSSAVACVNPLDDPDWDRKLAGKPGASFFHGSAWARVLHDTYGFRPVYFIRENPDDCDLLPLMEVDSWLTGRRGISLPFTDACAPTGTTKASNDQLIAAAVNYGRERRWTYCEFRGGRDSFGAARPSTSYYRHTLDLRRGVAALFAQADNATRRAVRKAEKSNLTLQFGRDLDTLQEFYGLLCKTRRRQGAPPQPFEFFRNIHRHILAQERGCVVLARSAGIPTAGALFLHSGNTAVYKFGASDERFQHLRGNNLVMWQAIAWHARQGFETLDFGRTSLGNEGLRRFKLGWGAHEHHIDYFKHDCRSGRFLADKDPTSGWHTHVFKRLPRSISRLIGAALYKHVA